MKLRINALREGFQTIKAALSSAELEITDDSLTQPIALQLDVDKGPQDMRIIGTVTTTANFTCDRCLSAFDQNLQSTFEVFASTATKLTKDDNLIVIAPNTQEIDLTGFIRDALLLSLPMKVLCREDCRGLCPVCGADRNVNPCSCQAQTEDERWEPLNSLKTCITEEN